MLLEGRRLWRSFIRRRDTPNAGCRRSGIRPDGGPARGPLPGAGRAALPSLLRAGAGTLCDGPLAVTEGTPPLFARLRLFLQHRIDSLFSGEIAASCGRCSPAIPRNSPTQQTMIWPWRDSATRWPSQGCTLPYLSVSCSFSPSARRGSRRCWVSRWWLYLPWSPALRPRPAGPL